MRVFENVLTSLLCSDQRAVAMQNKTKSPNTFPCITSPASIIKDLSFFAWYWVCTKFKQHVTQKSQGRAKTGKFNYRLSWAQMKDLGRTCHVLRETSSWIRICLHNRGENQIKILTYSPGDAIFPSQMAFSWTKETEQNTGLNIFIYDCCQLIFCCCSVLYLFSIALIKSSFFVYNLVLCLSQTYGWFCNHAQLKTELKNWLCVNVYLKCHRKWKWYMNWNDRKRNRLNSTRCGKWSVQCRCCFTGKQALAHYQLLRQHKMWKNTFIHTLTVL